VAPTKRRDANRDIHGEIIINTKEIEMEIITNLLAFFLLLI